MGKELPTRLCGGVFGEEELSVIRATIAAADGLSRAAVTRRVCAELGWVNEQGQLKEMGGRVALLALHREGWIDLPPPRNGNGNGRRPRAPEQWPPPLVIEGSVEQLKDLRLRQVDNASSSALWNGLIERYHYVGGSRLSGHQLRYLIEWQGGVLGAIGFGAAAVKLHARDQWIGWNEHQRRVRRSHVVNNRRFLILPWVQVRNLASRVLAMSARAVVRDYRQQYGICPLLLETFVESGRFSGSCYRAANWQYIGQSGGRGRGDRTHRAALTLKDVYVYPLSGQCRAVLTEVVR